jgi:hypothetical protein
MLSGVLQEWLGWPVQNMLLLGPWLIRQLVLTPAAAAAVAAAAAAAAGRLGGS